MIFVSELELAINYIRWCALFYLLFPKKRNNNNDSYYNR